MEGGLNMFGGELEPFLSRIRRHEDLADVDAVPRPCCGARLRVFFYPDGQSFQVLCDGSAMHLSVLQDIDDPPNWWKERVAEPVESMVSYFIDAPQ